MPPCDCLIFARYPEPGRVKTRLSPPLTAAQAADVHRASLLATVELVRCFAAASAAAAGGWAVRLRLLVTPDDRLADMAALCGLADDELRPQGEGDLGARLWRATVAAFDGGAGAVILLGADSPTLPPDRLTAACDALASADVAIGAARDGGYYLLALTGPHEAVFERIDWGGEHVCRQTIDRAESARLSVSRLPMWYDVDRPADLARALGDLSAESLAGRPAARALAGLLAGLAGQ
jgi:rSAM/selenodomain-associated transferase 1